VDCEVSDYRTIVPLSCVATSTSKLCRVTIAYFPTSWSEITARR